MHANKTKGNHFSTGPVTGKLVREKIGPGTNFPGDQNFRDRPTTSSLHSKKLILAAIVSTTYQISYIYCINK